METKQQIQTSGKEQTVECSKCHKQVLPKDGMQKKETFVCNECLNKKKKKHLVWGGIGTLVAIFAIIAVSVFALKDSKRTGEGFEGVGEIKDSINVSVNTNSVKFELSATTAVSSSVSTQKPISNLEEFKRVFAQNIESADNNNSTEVVIPSVSTFFKINTNYFVNDGEVLINEFVSAYEKTNKKAVILVEGYTCDLGGTRLNDLLSESRAEAVKKALINAGISETMVEIKWYGKSRYHNFKYNNKSEHRRVILSIK